MAAALRELAAGLRFPNRWSRCVCGCDASGPDGNPECRRLYAGSHFLRTEPARNPISLRGPIIT